MVPATTGDDGTGAFLMYLFVSGARHRSIRAVGAVRKLCESQRAGRDTLNMVDIYRNPMAARENHIVGVPALVKLAPLPKGLIVGDMTDTVRVAAGLGLPASLHADCDAP